MLPPSKAPLPPTSLCCSLLGSVVVAEVAAFSAFASSPRFNAIAEYPVAPAAATFVTFVASACAAALLPAPLLIIVVVLLLLVALFVRSVLTLSLLAASVSLDFVCTVVALASSFSATDCTAPALSMSNLMSLPLAMCSCDGFSPAAAASSSSLCCSRLNSGLVVVCKKRYFLMCVVQSFELD